MYGLRNERRSGVLGLALLFTALECCGAQSPSEKGQNEPPRLAAVVSELTSIADADETSRSIDSSAAPLPATGAPLKPAATADGNGACTGPGAEVTGRC